MYPDDVRQRALRLVESGLSLNQVSQRIGVSRYAIRDWRDNPTRVSRDCPMPAASSPAYAALFGYYLGDGCVSSLANGRAHYLRIACDARLPGIIRDVARCTSEVHPERPVHRVNAPGVVVVQNAWKHWPCLFPQHGPGRKHERHLGMTDWQWSIVEEHPAAFLRGLFHSDGCRANNWTRRVVAGEWKRYDYPRWQFTNHSEEIRKWCCEALDLLDIAWRRSNWKTISVSTRAGVARLDQLIGPKN